MLTDTDKRHLLIIAAATVVMLGLMYWLVIRTEQRLLQQTAERKQTVMAETELDRAYAAQWEKWHHMVEGTSNQLRHLEQELPTGDIYRWQLQRFLNPKSKGITVVQAEPPKPADSLIPSTNHNYTTVSFGLDGRASFHDFGRFLAEIENQYIHLRVDRLEMAPTMPDALQGEEARKLFFKLEFMSLSQSPSGLRPPGE